MKLFYKGIFACVVIILVLLIQIQSVQADFLTFEQKILSPDNDEVPFGYRIAIKDDKLLISNDTNGKVGAVDYYQKDANGIWQPIERINPPIDLSMETGWVNFGLTDLLGDELLVGAPFADHDGWADAGMAFLYQYDAGSNSWLNTAQFKSNNSNVAEFFGHVSLNTDQIAIGASNTKFNNIDSGRVYIYNRDPVTKNWQETQQIDSPYINTFSYFGYNLLITSNELFVANHKLSDSQNDGVYLYKKDTMGQFVLDKIMTPDGNTPIADFGNDILIEGNKLLISAGDEDLQPPVRKNGREGAVYFYKRDSQGNWVRQQKLVSPNPSIGLIFGRTIKLSNNVLLVTELLNIPAQNEGSAQIAIHQYQYNQTTQLWEHKQTIAFLEPGTFSQTFTGLGFDGKTAAQWGIEASTGKRIAAVYTMKMVPENKIDLSLSQTTDNTEIHPGNTFTVTYTVSNQGQDTSTGNSFATSDFNAVSSSINCAFDNRNLYQCPLQDLAPGESQSFSVSYSADPDPLSTGELKFISTVRTDRGEADSTNNGVLVKLNVTSPPPPPPSKGGGGSSDWLMMLLLSILLSSNRYQYFVDR